MIPVAAVKSNRGFTLIELLVVMAIIAIAASLIGPVALNQYERSKATAEREALLRLLDHYRFQAYSQNRTYTITTTPNQLLIQKGQPLLDKWGEGSAGAGLSEAVEFEFLSFPQQRLVLNRHGFWAPDTIAWREGERELAHELNMELIESGEEVSNATRE
ncbi:type II secretion system protein [Pseudidiomarina sp. E22-M8]|uniref:type II secretion system protein n=1 Tax=Pseudidiomarina sp. E22-M8 TaxID=3424768 RepID=UPI00403D4C54